MAGGRSQVVWESAEYALGRTKSAFAIWAKKPDGSTSHQPVASFPLSESGWATAWQTFAAWEGSPGTPPPIPMPSAQPVRNKWYRPTWWWTLPAAVVIAVAVLSILLVPSSNKTKSTGIGSSQPPVGTGYLASEPGGTIFLQWNQTGNAVSGTAQVDNADGNPPNETVSTDTVSVSGQINGSSISLSFNGGNTEFGTISGGSFTINFPQQDGTLAPVTFNSASATDFNQAVGRLHSEVDQANQTAANAAQLQQEQGAIQKAVQAVNDDLSALPKDASSIHEALQSFPGTLSQAQTDLATTASDEQKVKSEGGGGSACVDAGTVAVDAGTVSVDDGSAAVDGGGVESALSTARSDVRSLTSDSQAMQMAQSALPSFQAGAPTQGTINQAITSANQSIAAAVAQANGDIDQANG